MSRQNEGLGCLAQLFLWAIIAVLVAGALGLGMGLGELLR